MSKIRIAVASALFLAAVSLLAQMPLTGVGKTAAAGGGTVADVTNDICCNPCPATIALSTTTAGAHIFYTLGASASDPTHTADTATGSTVRIGSNSGSVSTGGSSVQTRFIRAVGYLSGSTDSNITEVGPPACGP
jgi:hypothetical protein